jgi:hypothetical protein
MRDEQAEIFAGTEQAAPAPRFSRMPAGSVGHTAGRNHITGRIRVVIAHMPAKRVCRWDCVASLVLVAVRASREIVVDAPPEVILEALADVGALSSWSPVHKRIEVLDCYADGRPHHVKATVRILGLVDKEILEYHWGPDWVIWDAHDTFQQRGQHVEYNLQPVGVDKTRVRFDITVEPSGPIPAFIVKRASEIVLDAATKGLRDQVIGLVERRHRRGHAESGRYCRATSSADAAALLAWQ